MKNQLFLSVYLMSLISLLMMNSAVAQDVAGSKDHALISRYAGSTLNAYVQEEYVELEIVTAKKPKNEQEKKYGDVHGGKLTSINYLGPSNRSALEIFRNYEKSINSAGLTILYKCELDGCRDRRLTGQNRYPYQVIGQRFDSAKWLKQAPSREWTDNPSYFLSAKLKKPSGDVYLILWVTPGYASTPEAGIFQFVLEEKQIDDGNITVDAKALSSGINNDGKIALYGIFFDTGKAELKPESKTQLDEMAKLFKQNAQLKTYIVGHTDNQGNFESNLILSQKRAEAVVASLVNTYKVNANRIIAKGSANLHPISSNNTETGRAKNRRVELVEQ